jgi:GR25 family glycosyltransferase involved in LPS biosynthesis
VKSNVINWAEHTHHEVQVKIQDKNLGLHLHAQIAYMDFFSRFQYGLVLEDDIEFRKSFIDFLDCNPELLLKTNSWSIEGHNPAFSSYTDFAFNQTVSFRSTHIHTIWGWASNSVNVEHFLSYVNKSHSFHDLTETIDLFADTVTSDKCLKNAIRATWLRKSLRAMSGGGSWDNWWELAAWNSGKRSLIPNFSLTREILNQDEGHSHPHLAEGKIWVKNTSELVCLSDLEYSKYEKKLDVELLKVWGITRKYSWARSSLIKRQIGEMRDSFPKMGIT